MSLEQARLGCAHGAGLQQSNQLYVSCFQTQDVVGGRVSCVGGRLTVASCSLQVADVLSSLALCVKCCAFKHLEKLLIRVREHREARHLIKTNHVVGLEAFIATKGSKTEIASQSLKLSRDHVVVIVCMDCTPQC
eukprot:2763932-Amphidinium_carterae.2